MLKLKRNNNFISCIPRKQVLINPQNAKVSKKLQYYFTYIRIIFSMIIFTISFYSLNEYIVIKKNL